MTELCPKCGQRLRAGWFRCPRCRELVPEAPPPPVDEPVAETTSPRWPWIGASIAALVLIVLVIGIVGDSERENSEAAEETATGALATTRSEPRPIDPAVLARNKSGDAKIAGYGAYLSGDLNVALAKFEEAVSLHPDDPEARNNLGQVLVRLNRAGDALTHLDEAVRLDGTKWKYRFNRARAYSQLNRLTDAATDYRVAANIFPEDYVTHYNLGLVLLKDKQYPDAVAALERAVALAPGEPSFLISLGTAYVAAERPDRAKATFEQFLQDAPDDPEAPRVKDLLRALANSQAS